MVAVTDGRGRGAPARLCAQLEAHGGDVSAVTEVTRDMAASYSLGCADAMPNASQTVDRFHVMQLALRAVERVRCAEAKSSEEKRRLLKGSKYCWLKRPENLTPRQAARKASLMSEHLLTARACAMAEALRAVYGMPDRGSAEAELDRCQEGRPRLPQPRQLHRADLPQARPPGVLSRLRVGLCYPLETSKSQKRPPPPHDTGEGVN